MSLVSLHLPCTILVSVLCIPPNCARAMIRLTLYTYMLQAKSSDQLLATLWVVACSAANASASHQMQCHMFLSLLLGLWGS